MGPYVLCLVTIDDPEQAARIAQRLVDAKLAACVNILPEIRSIYSWNGETCDEIEKLLIIKTRRSLFPDILKTVRELHPYEVPEVVSLNIDEGLPEYLRWIDESVLEKSATD